MTRIEFSQDHCDTVFVNMLNKYSLARNAGESSKEGKALFAWHPASVCSNSSLLARASTGEGKPDQC